jgi:NADH-quinone oxidoreductase subunit H
VNKFYYMLAPVVALAPALTTMVVLPFGRYVDVDGVTQPLVLANVDLGMLIILGHIFARCLRHRASWLGIQ